MTFVLHKHCAFSCIDYLKMTVPAHGDALPDNIKKWVMQQYGLRMLYYQLCYELFLSFIYID